MIRRVSRALAVLACGALFAPVTAHACAVCFDPNETTRNAYAYTAAFLTLLPLLLSGGLFWWIRRRAAMLDATSSPPQMNGISRA
ncbi:MAG: hypothetical protein D6798_12970, partial [Deltaproteobacteria bacterium]